MLIDGKVIELVLGALSGAYVFAYQEAISVCLTFDLDDLEHLVPVGVV